MNSAEQNETVSVLFVHERTDFPQFRGVAEAIGCSVEEVFSLRQALTICRVNPGISALVCTPNCPDGEWSELLSELREFPDHPEVLLITGDRNPTFWAEALVSGVFEVLAAPFQSDEVQRLLRIAHERCQRKREIEAERRNSTTRWMKISESDDSVN